MDCSHSLVGDTREADEVGENKVPLHLSVALEYVAAGGCPGGEFGRDVGLFLPCYGESDVCELLLRLRSWMVDGCLTQIWNSKRIERP